MKLFSFSRRYRLLKLREFQAGFTTGKKKTSKSFVFYIKPNTLEVARLGIIVAKRQVKTAVARNRYKRLLRESFRQYKQQLAGHDFIVIVRAVANQLNQQQLRNELEQQWEIFIKPGKN